MSTEVPERIKYQREHYACTNPQCLAEHDGEYISLTAHERAVAEARRETWSKSDKRLEEIRERRKCTALLDCGTSDDGKRFVAYIYEAEYPHRRVATMENLYDIQRLNFLAKAPTDIDYLLSLLDSAAGASHPTPPQRVT